MQFMAAAPAEISEVLRERAGGALVGKGYL